MSEKPGVAVRSGDQRADDDNFLVSQQHAILPFDQAG
jgi:hypothetical protein